MANESVSSKTDRNPSTSGARGSVKSCSSSSVLPLPGGTSCWLKCAVELFLCFWACSTSTCLKPSFLASRVEGSLDLTKGNVDLETLLLVSNFLGGDVCLRGMVNWPPRVPSSPMVTDGFHSHTLGHTNTEGGAESPLPTTNWLKMSTRG